jgi:hypothetical protein
MFKLPFEFLLFPSFICVVATIYVITETMKGNLSKASKTNLIALGAPILITSVFLIDTIFWFCSYLGFYKLPVVSGNMSDVQAVAKVGGMSSFAIDGTILRIDTLNNNLLKDKDYCKVEYTPITHFVISLEKL